MKLLRLGGLIAITIFSLIPAAKATPLVHDEAVHGELAGNTDAPTALQFDVGANVVRGSAGRPLSGPFDLDVFTFTVAAGQQLIRIDLTEFTPAGSFGTGSFMAIAAGAKIDHFAAETHLGDALVAGSGDLLSLLAGGGPWGASGFERPLGAGTYTFWIEEASTTIEYALEFEIVPEAGTFLLVASGIAGLAGCGVRRRTSE